MKLSSIPRASNVPTLETSRPPDRKVEADFIIIPVISSGIFSIRHHNDSYSVGCAFSLEEKAKSYCETKNSKRSSSYSTSYDYREVEVDSEKESW